MSEIIDIDAAASEFEPVRIRFRGEVHVLGGSVLSLLNAASQFTDDMPDAPDEDGLTEGQLAKLNHAYIGKVFEFLRPTLRALSPSMASAIKDEDLTAAEEAALLEPVTQALGTIAGLSFRADGGKPDPGSGGEVSELLPAV